MKQVTMYSTPICGYCAAARRLLQEKGAPVQEINVMMNPGKRSEMMARANGRRTVPQIFIGDHHVGGFDDMAALDREGKLDGLLAD